jgi:predicted MFS family arabinose efflux permease
VEGKTVQQEQQKKKEVKQKPLNKGQRIFADLLKTTLNTKQTPNSPRKIFAGSVLATCLAFLLAILSQKIDITLLIASCLFAFPIPFLVIGFIISSYDFEDQRLQLLSSIVFTFEKMGIIIVALGVLFVEYHISSYVFWSTLFSLIVFMVITALILIRKGVNLGIPQAESKQTGE